MQRIQFEEPERLRKYHGGIPADLEAVVSRCLEKDPKRRYATAAELAEDLRRFLAGEPVRARPVGAWERAVKWARRRPAIAALLASLVCVAALGFALVVWKWQEATAALDREALTAAERQARQQAQKDQKQAERARDEAEQERRKGLQLNARLAMERGVSLCQEGEIFTGLLWLSRSLDIAAQGKAIALQDSIRLLLTGWSWDSHRPQALFFQKTGVEAVAFSPDGKMVLTGGLHDEKNRLWDVRTGQPVGPPLNHLPAFARGAFSPNGKTLVTISTSSGKQPGQIRIWEVATGKQIGASIPQRSAPFVLFPPAFSPDSKTFLALSDLSTAQLWDAGSGKRVGEPLKHGGEIKVLAFNPNGQTVFTGADRVDPLEPLPPTEGIIWSAATGKSVGQPIPLKQTVRAAAYSLDGKALVTGTASNDPFGGIGESAGGAAQLWDAATGKPLCQPLPHPHDVVAVAFDPKGKTFVTACADGKARVWERKTQQVIWEFPHLNAAVTALAFSPDGKKLLTAGEDYLAGVWNMADGAPVGRWTPAPAPVRAVAFSPDGQFILTGSQDGQVQMREIAPERNVGDPMRHGSGVKKAVFTPDGQTVVTASGDTMVRLWDATSGASRGSPLKHPGSVEEVAVSADGKTLLSVGYGQRGLGKAQEVEAWLWDVARQKLIGTLAVKGSGGRPVGVTAAVFSPDGRTVLAAYQDKTIQLWKARTAEPRSQPLRQPHFVRALAFSPDGKTFLLGGDWVDEGVKKPRIRDSSPLGAKGIAQLWDAHTAKPVGQPLVHPGSVHGVAFSPDGNRFLTASRDNAARLWNARTRKPVGDPLRHRNVLTVLSFSPDSRTVLTASQDGVAQLWEAGTAKPLLQLGRHRVVIHAGAFSPDGKFALTGTSDGYVRLWDTATGKLIGPPLWNPGAVNSVAFRPDGKTFVAASGYSYAEKDKLKESGTALLWKVPVPMEGEVDRIQLFIQVLTGMAMDANDRVDDLDEGTWQKRIQQLRLQKGLAK
jgi:WD40 repeat protein